MANETTRKDRDAALSERVARQLAAATHLSEIHLTNDYAFRKTFKTQRC